MTWAPNYASTEELASFVRIGDTADDAQLALAIAAASRAIDHACNRQFGKADTPTARYYTARWDHSRWDDPYAQRQWPLRGWGYSAGRYWAGWMTEIDDLATTADLTIAVDAAFDGTYAGTITDYQLRPANAPADGRPWSELWVRPSSSVQPTAFVDGLRVTARWGWVGIPDTVRQACLLQASRLIARRDSPFGVAGSPEMGSELRLLARLDADVAVTLRPYRRMWGAA